MKQKSSGPKIVRSTGLPPELDREFLSYCTKQRLSVSQCLEEMVTRCVHTEKLHEAARAQGKIAELPELLQFCRKNFQQIKEGMEVIHGNILYLIRIIEPSAEEQDSESPDG